MIYGHDKTIHGTQEVNVVRDRTTGKVVAVWFRCMTLPFTDGFAYPSRVKELEQSYKNNRPNGILAIEFSDEVAPDPDSYTIGGLGLHPPKDKLKIIPRIRRAIQRF